MCGRFLLSVDVEDLLERYRAYKGWATESFGPEIFPSNTVPAVLDQGARELVPLKWGFVSPYAKGLIINSRGETVDSKPMFRRAFRQKRCIIPANSFFEWKKVGRTSTKYRISLKEQPIFSMAGIYDEFLDREEKPFAAFSIITINPNPLMAQIHDRMPVILDKGSEELWLNNKLQSYELLKALIRPYDEEQMTMEVV